MVIAVSHPHYLPVQLTVRQSGIRASALIQYHAESSEALNIAQDRPHIHVEEGRKKWLRGMRVFLSDEYFSLTKNLVDYVCTVQKGEYVRLTLA